ncbi:MAG TPA: carbohydrate-binding protein [Niastella sp.]|nr:carbohydrate-binding protein [Niastella sp.]
MCNKLLLLFACTVSFITGRAQEFKTEKLNVSASAVSEFKNAVVYLPKGYTESKKYPLIIYAHSLGQAGTDINKLYTTGLPYVLKNGYQPSFDFIMIAPQSASYSVPPFWLDGILKEAQNRWPIDTNRIYLTGIDAGGWTAYGSQLNVSSAIAKKFAAMVTVSAATQNVSNTNISWWKNSSTPLWAITGEGDKNYVTQNTNLVTAVNKEVDGLATITVQPGTGHDGWNAAYRGGVKLEGKTMWEWLYQFDRSKTFSKAHMDGVKGIAAAPTLATTNTLEQSLLTNSATLITSGTVIQAENYADRSGILIQTTRDYSGGLQNTFDVASGDWISYAINAPASGSYTLCFRVACDASSSRFQIKNSSGTVLTTVNVPNTNGWQTWRDVTAVINLSAGPQRLKLQSASTTGWNLNYFQIAKTPLNAFASYTLRPNSGTSIYLPLGLNLAHLKGGDTLNILGGAYNVIELGNFRGTSTNPIIIRNKGGQVTCKIIRLSNTPEYFKLLGNGQSGITYGFKINGASSTGSCLTAFGTDFEIGYIEGMYSKSGFFIKKNPVAGEPETQFPNYEMDNISIHHNYLHDITGEAMYIGHTAADGGQGGNMLLPVRMRNVEIAYNTINKTGWDGIQLANATTGNKIHHNTVTNFGTTNKYGQQAGILLGGNSQADIYNNTIKNGTGNAIQNFGFGLNKIYYNLIENVGRNGTDRGYEGVYCNDIIIKSEKRPKQQIQAYNNTIKYPKPWGAIRVSGYNQNSLPATMQYNKVLLPNAPSNWQKLYFPTYVPNSIISGNTIITQ